MSFTYKTGQKLMLLGLIPGLTIAHAAIGVENSQLPRQLTWEMCVHEAANTNPALRASRENSLNQEAQYKGSFSNFYPQLSVSANGTDTHTTNHEGSFASHTDTQHYSGQFSAQQMIFDGFKTGGKVAQSSANYRVALMSEAIEKSTVHYALKSAFAQMLYAQELQQLSEHIATARKSEAQQVELKYDGGQEDKGSYLLTAANYRNALYGVSQAQRNLKVSQRQLAQIMGRITVTDIQVTGVLKTKTPVKEPDYVALAAGSPTLLQSEMTVEAAKSGITLARSEFWPTLTADATMTKDGKTLLPRKDSWQAGLTVSLPLFDGGQNYFDVRAATAKYRQSLASRQNTNDQIVYNLEQSYNALLNAIELVEVNRQLLIANSTRAEITEAKYANGLASFQDYDQIQNSLINQQKAELQSRRDAVLAEAGWELAQGTGEIP